MSKRKLKAEILEIGLCTKCGVNRLERTKVPFWCKSCISKAGKAYYYRSKDDVAAFGNSAHIKMYGNCRRGALQRNKDFLLTPEEFEVIISKPCFYCGSSQFIGVDRVDNSVGYVLGNAVACCKFCNFAKNKLTRDDFLAWVDRIATYQGYKKLDMG